MRFNFFILLTGVLLALLLAHSFLWFFHSEGHIHDACPYSIFPYEEPIMMAAITLSTFLIFVGAIAYLRDRRLPLLLISLAYVVLFLHCSLWIVASYLYPVDALHTISHDFGIVFIIASLALLMAAVIKNNERRKKPD